MRKLLILILSIFLISCNEMTEKDRVEFLRVKKRFKELKQEYHNLNNDTCIGMQTEQDILNEKEPPK